MGTRIWLDKLLRNDYLPRIAALTDTKQGQQEAVEILGDILQACAEQGLTTIQQQQGPIDQVRATIRQELGEHFSLQWIKLDREDYFQINRDKQNNARTRQLQQQYLSNPDAIVALAVRLLESLEWAEVAAGLAVLTGRRLNEVLETAEFTVKSQWVVTFQGALKRRGEAVPLVFDIPTLTTAQRIVDATRRLRKMVPPDANETKVGQVSDRLFSELVPTPAGKANLYAHLWRSVYCCIATFWYCPKHVDDLLFKAHIMGHFETLTQQEQGDDIQLRQRLETFGSERHYRLYEIDDAIIAQYNGKRKGIKLGQAGIEPLEVFTLGMPEHQLAPMERKPRTSFHIWKQDYPTIIEILQHFEGRNQMERANAWITWTIEQLQQERDQERPTEMAITPVEDQESPTPAPDNSNQEPVQEPHPVSSKLEEQLAELVSVMREFIAVQTAPPSKKRSPRPSQAEPASAPPTEGDEKPARGRKRGGDDAIIDQVIDAIIAYNNAPGRSHDEKWFLTANLLKKFTERGNQRAAERVLSDRAEEVNQHHQQHQLKTDHNNRHKKHDIKAIVHI